MNKYLLDTHTILWFFNGDKNLSTKVKNIITSGKNICYLSIASLWEIAIKIKLGKLDIGIPFKDFTLLLTENDIRIIHISFLHLQELISLEEFHGDPFDKLIITQSIAEDMILLSKDKNFKLYPELKLVW